MTENERASFKLNLNLNFEEKMNDHFKITPYLRSKNNI